MLASGLACVAERGLAAHSKHDAGVRIVDVADKERLEWQQRGARGHLPGASGSLTAAEGSVAPSPLTATSAQHLGEALNEETRAEWFRNVTDSAREVVREHCKTASVGFDEVSLGKMAPADTFARVCARAAVSCAAFRVCMLASVCRGVTVRGAALLPRRSPRGCPPSPAQRAATR
jgi:hypothetical protein